jgi:general secretion pathway protein D
MTASSLVPPVAAQGAPARPATNESVMLNFVNADIDAVVRAIGQFTNRTFVVDPRIKGTLSLVTERPVSREQAYDQLLTALRLQGFTIVQTGNVARVVPEADAKLQGGTVVSPASAPPRGDQLVTQVFRLQYESATAMVPILRPLIAPNNTISAYPQNNTLVITDYADNLRRIQRIIESIDTPATSSVEMVPIKHGLAMEIGTVINRVLDEGARAAGQAIDAGQRTSVLAEPRTNSLILRAPSAARLALAKNLIEQLDKPALTPGNINVVYLRNAEAARLAPLLRAIIGSDPSFVPQASTSGLSQPTGGSSGGPGLTPGQTGAAGGTAPGIPAIASGGSAAAGGLAGMIQADTATNSLIITAPDPLYRNIRAIVDKLDVRRAQVVIESLIAEVSAERAAEFGIQWQALSGINETGTNAIGGTNFGGSGQNIIGVAQNLASVGQGLNIGVVKGKINIPGVGEILNLGFLARALETKADANILSTPTIQTLDNEEAKFLVGQNIPLITGSYASTGGGGGAAGVNPFQTFERRDIGLQLRVKPQISEGGVVRLAIYQELSSIQNTLTASQGGIITNKRSFESTVLVEDGNIVVLGGLIEDKTDNSRSQVPVLGSIPFIGEFFKYESRKRTKTNLLVFLRPYVVREEGTSSALAMDRYDYIRGQVAAGTLQDNFIFRDLQSRQIPEKPPVPPAMKRAQESAPAPSGKATPAPAASPAPAAAPAPVPEPASSPAPSAPPAPSSSAPPPGQPVAPAATAPGSTGAAAPSTGAFAAQQGVPPAGGTIHLLEVAAVTEVARGRELQRQLREAGFDAYWENVKTRTGDVVRVRVSVDSATQSVADAVAKLKAMGLDPIIVTP